MTAKLRPGRKKVTSSFVMTPDLHKWFSDNYPKIGDKSYIFEQLIQMLKDGSITVPPRPRP